MTTTASGTVPTLSGLRTAAVADERVIVGIGDMQIARGDGQLIMTFGLGSCIGLTVWDPGARIGAMLHAMLPTLRLGGERLRDNPFMFVDAGVPEMFRRCYAEGLQKTEAQCYVAGGACTRADPEKDIFQIGRKNLAVLDALLEKNHVALRGRHVGGHHSRTLTLDIATGEVSVQSGRETVKL